MWFHLKHVSWLRDLVQNPITSVKWIILTLWSLCESSVLLEARKEMLFRITVSCAVVSPSITPLGSKGRGREYVREKPSDWTEVEDSVRLTFLSLALAQRQHFLLSVHLRGGECGGPHRRWEGKGRMWIHILELGVFSACFADVEYVDNIFFTLKMPLTPAP